MDEESKNDSQKGGQLDILTISPTMLTTAAPTAAPITSSAAPTKPNAHPELAGQLASDSWFFLGKAPPPTAANTPVSTSPPPPSTPTQTRSGAKNTVLTAPVPVSASGKLAMQTAASSSGLPPGIPPSAIADMSMATATATSTTVPSSVDDAFKKMKEENAAEDRAQDAQTKAGTEKYTKPFSIMKGWTFGFDKIMGGNKSPDKDSSKIGVLPPLPLVTPSYAPSPRPLRCIFLIRMIVRNRLELILATSWFT